MKKPKTGHYKSLIEEYVEILSGNPGKGLHTKEQTASHGQPLRAKVTIPEPDQVLNIHLNS